MRDTASCAEVTWPWRCLCAVPKTLATMKKRRTRTQTRSRGSERTNPTRAPTSRKLRWVLLFDRMAIGAGESVRLLHRIEHRHLQHLRHLRIHLVQHKLAPARKLRILLELRHKCLLRRWQRPNVRTRHTIRPIRSARSMACRTGKIFIFRVEGNKRLLHLRHYDLGHKHLALTEAHVLVRNRLRNRLAVRTTASCHEQTQGHRDTLRHDSLTVVRSARRNPALYRHDDWAARRSTCSPNFFSRLQISRLTYMESLLASFWGRIAHAGQRPIRPVSKAAWPTYVRNLHGAPYIFLELK